MKTKNPFNHGFLYGKKIFKFKLRNLIKEKYLVGNKYLINNKRIYHHFKNIRIGQTTSDNRNIRNNINITSIAIS
mgnify:CR=1 FL=1